MDIQKKYTIHYACFMEAAMILNISLNKAQVLQGLARKDISGSLSSEAAIKL